MREKLAAMAIFAALFGACGSASAMSTPEQALVHCRVVGGGKLPPGLGGEQAICAALKQAVVADLLHGAPTIEVRVVSASLLAATVTTADGRILPELRMATMDRLLTKAAIRRFARAIADELVKAGRS